MRLRHFVRDRVKQLMGKGEFVWIDNYNLRLRPIGTRKVTEEVNRWFNKTVQYQCKEYPWHYVMLLKARELAHYLFGKKKMPDFVAPAYTVDRQDSDEIRQKILDISYTEWKEMGFSKGTLHYMKQNAKSGKPFTLNKHVRERLEHFGQ